VQYKQCDGVNVDMTYLLTE